MNENVHKGHRIRVKQKYRRAGLNAFSEHEILEFLLFYCIPQRDTNELAHKLISRFGSISSLLLASYDDIKSVDGMGENSALFIKLLSDIYGLCNDKPKNNTVLDTTDKIGEYVVPLFRTATTEHSYIIALDSRHRPIRCVKVHEGDLNTTAFPLRDIRKILVNCDAYGAILAHNHPNGSALPSEADIKATQILDEMLKYLGVRLIDHIIVVENDYVSLRDSQDKLIVT